MYLPRGQYPAFIVRRGPTLFRPYPPTPVLPLLDYLQVTYNKYNTLTYNVKGCAILRAGGEADDRAG